MGKIVHALIEHSLTPEEIVNLPEQLRNFSNDVLVGQWYWTKQNMDKEALIDLWTRKAEYFINNSWDEQDLALLKKGDLAMHFSSPYLLTFDNSLAWDTYRRNTQLRKEFNQLTKAISTVLNAVDILFVPDLSNVGFFNEDEDLTVEAYRQKAKGNMLYAIELD